MRKLFALLCFSLIFPVAWAADPAMATPTDTYISTRDRYIADLRAHPLDGSVETKALRELEGLLKTLIPSWMAPGFPTEGKINLATLYDSDLGFGALDGLAYEGSGTRVAVSTPALLRRWLTDHNRWWEGRDGLPQTFKTASPSEALYTFASDGDFDEQAAYSYGEIPVRLNGDTGAVVLLAFSQDLVMDRGPSAIGAAVLHGHRVFVAEKTLTIVTTPPPFCQRRLKLDLKRLEVSKEHPSEEKADRDYRACFATHLREQPHYNEIIREAQMLVDLLH